MDKVITSKLIQINMCWDGKKWVITHSFKSGAKVPAGYKGSIADVETISNQYADKVKETGVKKSDDGENYYEGIDFIQALAEVKETTLTLCNNAKVPEKYWDDKNADYPKSPFHGPTRSGIGDGAIAELKDIPELVGFGLQIATEPGKAGELWNGIKSITPAKVKKMALGAAQEKLDKYAAGGNTMKHEAGKDAVSIAMFVAGATKEFFENGRRISELGEVVDELENLTDEALGTLGSSVDEGTGKAVNKAIKNSEVDSPTLENSRIDIADKNKKWTFVELQALWKRGNDFNKKAADNLWYQANEVVIEHPTLRYIEGPNKGKARRFRLDSYNPNDVIVSRKATDLGRIQQSTFESYLSE